MGVAYYAALRYSVGLLVMMQLSDTFTFMLGLVRQLYIADSIVQDDGNGRFKLDTKALNPLSRLGAGEYASFGEVIQLKSPL